jgi:hypothetical protein
LRPRNFEYQRFPRSTPEDLLEDLAVRILQALFEEEEWKERINMTVNRTVNVPQ